MNTESWSGGPNSLHGKLALVTGGTRGIGFSIAEMLAKHGTQVVICGKSEESVKTALSRFDTLAPSKVNGKAADVKHHEEVQALFEFVDRTLGGLDILVNNAGIGRFGAVSQISPQDWADVLGTNLTGTFYCTQEALARFAPRRGGYVVNVSSLAGKNPFAGGAAYNASKFGVNGFSEAVMLDSRYENVRVTTVMPGSVATEFGMTRPKDGKDWPDAGRDWKIWPQDVADVVRAVLEMPARTTVSAIEIRPSQPKRK